jgi:hypothetical protein
LRYLVVSVFFFFLLFSSINSYADFCTDFPLDPACDGGPDPDAPLDSGVGFLIGAAALYTIKKIKDKSQKADETPRLQ